MMMMMRRESGHGVHVLHIERLWKSVLEGHSPWQEGNYNFDLCYFEIRIALIYSMMVGLMLIVDVVARVVEKDVTYVDFVLGIVS